MCTKLKGTRRITFYCIQEFIHFQKPHHTINLWQFHPRPVTFYRKQNRMICFVRDLWTFITNIWIRTIEMVSLDMLHGLENFKMGIFPKKCWHWCTHYHQSVHIETSQILLYDNQIQYFVFNFRARYAGVSSGNIHNSSNKSPGEKWIMTGQCVWVLVHKS